MDGNHNVAMDTTDDKEEKTKTLKRKASKMAKVVEQEVIQVHPGDKIELQLALQLGDGLHLTDDAPSSWQIYTHDGNHCSLFKVNLSENCVVALGVLFTVTRD